MKHIKLTFISVFLLTANLCFSQANLKGDLILNVGFSKSDLLKKPFNFNIQSDGKIETISQKSVIVPDMNFIYLFKLKNKKINPIAGIGYSQVGLIENGNCNINDTLYKYFFKFSTSYFNYFGGAYVNIFKNKKSNIHFIQTINLMRNLDNYSNFKKNTISTRSQILFSHEFPSKFILSFAAFIQSGLMKFNKSEIDNKGQKYIPYLVGFNIGTYFNTSNKRKN